MVSENPRKQIRHLLEDCLSAAKRHDYAVALTAVNDALKAHETDKSIPLVQILEHRVAVYLRMDLLDQALKDGKAMIRLDPKDARGYIRSGIAERRKNNKPAATKYFEHGLKRVPPSDPNHALLVREMEETAQQMRTEIVLSRAKDPLSVLPIEVIEIVISFLDYRSNIRLLRVSRSWNKIVTSSHPLIDTLAFPNSTKPITPKWLVAALKRCSTLKTVKLSVLTSPAATYLGSVLQQGGRFPALEYFEWLDIESSQSRLWLPVCQYDLRVIIIDCQKSSVPVERVDTVLRRCRSLETAKFHLREIELHFSDMISLDSDAISFVCPELRSLSYKFVRSPIIGILDLSHMRKLRSLSVSNIKLTAMSLPASLVQLRLVSCMFLGHIFDAVDHHPTLNELEDLQVHDCTLFPVCLLISIQKTKPGKLSKCSVTATEVAARDLVMMMSTPWFQTLKYLRIVDFDFISPYAFQYIKDCLALEEVCLEKAAKLGTFVSDLIREAAHLRKVSLLDCPNVGRDLIPWAKERGVEVEIIQRDRPLGSGRRVVETY
ncbi:hypothetical protein AYO22_10631 [Fonsecaea multimorphosa]|nr:hypothetical protein AYO22_10631 [Fonsecaea multimorphosa]